MSTTATLPRIIEAAPLPVFNSLPQAEQVNLLVDGSAEDVALLLEKEFGPAELAAFKVLTPEGPRLLPMTHGLTGRWGELNDFTSKTRFAAELRNTPVLLDHLRACMFDGYCFVVATPKGYGLHIEAEYYSVETDSSDGFTPNHTFEEAKQRILDAIPGLRERWPDVTFCVGDTDWTFDGRVALWAIVRPDRYTRDELKQLVLQFPA